MAETIRSTRDFLGDVRTELEKVTWPTRKETTISAVAVFTMVLISSIFLFLSDQIIAFVVRMILGFGG